MKVLLTCFGPFGGETVNPSQQAVEALAERVAKDAEVLPGVELRTAMLPLERLVAISTLANLISEFEPDVVICTGQNGGSTHIAVERIGINVDDYSMPDDGGNQPVDELVVSDGPAAYFATLPARRIVNALRAAGIPAAVSNSAGTFLCNHVLYGLLDLFAKTDSKATGGFIHVPYSSEQVATRPSQPSLPLEAIIAALTIAVKEADPSVGD